MSSAVVTTTHPSRLASSSGCSPKNYAFLQQFIRAESGIVIEDDKHYLLETRLLPVAKSHGFDSLDSLSTALASRSSAAVRLSVVDAMTTNETLFFRDTSLFEALRKDVLPALFEGRRGTRRLRIWSAAASTGQEAYSLAMMMLEMGKSPSDVEIVGTDLATHVLDRARKGKYGQFEVSRGLPSSYLVKYFNRAGLDWEVKDAVKKLVRFQQLDLRKDLRSLSTFDLILCRNVLIYFDAPTKSSILDAIRKQLSPGGLLALGCAETVINVHAGFRRKTFSQAALYSRSEDI